MLPPYGHIHERYIHMLTQDAHTHEGYVHILPPDVRIHERYIHMLALEGHTHEGYIPIFHFDEYHKKVINAGCIQMIVLIGRFLQVK